MFDLVGILYTFPAVLIAITVQGYAKAKMADKLGDKLPRFQGRVTLNPSAHVDLIGFLMLLVFRFGWTKPVETNPSAYKRGRKDSIKVSIAPLIGNLITAFIFSFIYVGAYNFIFGIVDSTIAYVLVTMLSAVVQVNISLMIFNLIPIPGLCGWNILRDLNPKLFFKFADKIYQYQMPILLGVILLSGYILSTPIYLLSNLFIRIASMFFGIFI